MGSNELFMRLIVVGLHDAKNILAHAGLLIVHAMWHAVFKCSVKCSVGMKQDWNI